MKNNFKKAFSLVELLVVISIIGILAGIVLVSLNSSKQKGRITRIKSDVLQLKLQLESDVKNSNDFSQITDVQSCRYSATGTTYNGCTGALNPPSTDGIVAGSKYESLINDSNKNGANSWDIRLGGVNTPPTSSDTGKYVIVTRMSESGNYYCVDYLDNTEEASTSTFQLTQFKCK